MRFIRTRSILLSFQVLVQLLSQKYFPFVLTEETCSTADYFRAGVNLKTHQVKGICKISTKRGTLPLSRLKSDKVGEIQFVVPYGQGNKPLKLITRSLRPLLFEIPNFLSNEECSHIIKSAESQVMEESYTEGDRREEKSLVEENSSGEEKQQSCDELMEYDSEKDGLLSPPEFSLFLKKLSGIPVMAEILSKAFQELDEDGDGFITVPECLLGNHTAVTQILRNVEDGDHRYRDRFSRQTWINIHHSSDPVFQSLHERVVGLVKLPREMVQRSEYLQVVRYTKYGHYHAHYDSQEANEKLRCCGASDSTMPGSSAPCKLCRYLTILYYLNDVDSGGETAFPVADNATFSKKVVDDSDLHNLSTHCQKANLIVKPKKGTAILWYNHLLDQDTGLLGPNDEFSLHGGCDVLEGEKWIANTWINYP